MKAREGIALRWMYAILAQLGEYTQMQPDDTRPFATVESALEFMHLLSTAIADTAADVQQDIEEAQAATDQRRIEALQMVSYKLQLLGIHVGKSERLLNDLRRLRTVILAESKTSNYVAASVTR